MDARRVDPRPRGALNPGERDLLEWAAAVGDRFDVRLVAAASALSADEVLARVDGLIAAGLVIEVPGDPTGNALAFRHALVREALTQEERTGGRRRRHARILDAAEALTAEGVLDVSAGDLARHAVAAGERERAMKHSRAAATGAQELGAVEEAVEHLERALSLWIGDDGQPLRAELLVATGRLRTRLTHGEERVLDLLETALDTYELLGDRLGASGCRAALADAHWWLGEHAVAFQHWSAALPELRASGSPEALRSTLAAYALGEAIAYHQDAALAAAEEGLLLVGGVSSAQDAFDRVSLLSTKGLVALWRCDAATGRALLSEAASLAVEHHDDLGAARAHHTLAMANTLLVPVAETADHLRRAAELVARHGLRTREAHYLSLVAWAAVQGGEWEAASSLDR